MLSAGTTWDAPKPIQTDDLRTFDLTPPVATVLAAPVPLSSPLKYPSVLGPPHVPIFLSLLVLRN
ncbi:hypothetical protein FRUB_02767 [Fimbriiglobus ruber]|uniref:Uncharacterized protein n=1 Tax=Fimbriiglobus ruber TaxID=1908690 RepID=A0A225DXC8_9BACT|nr:hypothetical protein FRUB_02767 [Fimbriiglobus ruber]